MKDRLRYRLPQASEEEIETYYQIVTQYDLKLTLDNLDTRGLILFDRQGRRVRISFGSWRNKSIIIPSPDADVVIGVVDGMIGGWVPVSKIENLEDISILDLKMLNPMPEEFDFSEKCAHMMMHGGFLRDGFWECAGCDQRLIPGG